MVLLKIALMGDGAVGKTSLRERYMGRPFQGTYMMTIGADFATKNTEIDGKEVKFQIWDLAGQPRFSSVRDIYYRGTTGALLVYDVTRQESFIDTPKWIEECFNSTGIGAVPIVILGNKIDLRDKVPNSLDTKYGIALAEEISKISAKKGFDATYIETSAMSGENVSLAFETLGRKIFVMLEKQKAKLKKKQKIG